jgi:hypothetical protein
MKTKPKVGDKLIMVEVRYGPQTPKVVEVLVTSVRTKYFTVTWSWNLFPLSCEFGLVDWRERSKYAPTKQLYASMEDYRDSVEHDTLFRKFRDSFGVMSKNFLTLDQLRRIDAITKEAK